MTLKFEVDPVGSVISKFSRSSLKQRRGPLSGGVRYPLNLFADETGGNGVLWYLSDTQNTVRDVAKCLTPSANTDDPTTATVNDGDRPGLEGTGNEFSP